MNLGVNRLDESGKQSEGVPMEQAYQERMAQMERDRLEAEAIRQAGYELARGPVRTQEQLMGEWEREQSYENHEDIP